MKYIRTEDGIFDIEKSSEYGVLTLTKIFDKEYYDKLGLKEGDKYVIINHQDIKITENSVSDTVEELCDVMVIFRPPLFKPYIIQDTFEYVKKYYGENSLSKNKWKQTEVYGAIWTDKGLIYVAKMNDKGELELL